MTETTLLAIVTVACTAGATILNTLIQHISSALATKRDEKYKYKQRQIEALEEYAEIVFHGGYLQRTDQTYKLLGSIYVYIHRSLWPRIDSINASVMNHEKERAIEQFSKLLEELNLPNIYISATTRKK